MNSNINFSFIIKDNESVAAATFERGDYLLAIFLVHICIESLLRLFLNETQENIRFIDLIDKYQKFLKSQYYVNTNAFVDELTKFNQRRNRIIHQLWRKGYTYTNKQSKSAADASLKLYGLLIEWLETWDEEIITTGFYYD